MHRLGLFLIVIILLVSRHLDAQEPSTPSPKPPIASIPFFRNAVGIWNGTGASQVAGQANALPVLDSWKAGFVENQGETLFVQDGEIQLGNGSSFTYRWIYKLDLQRNVVLAQFSSSNGDKGVSRVTLQASGTRIQVSPADPATKQGMFTDVWFDEQGRYSYQSQVRNEAGKPFIQTKVSCVRASDLPNSPVRKIE